MINKLIYLACKTRPDIAFAVEQFYSHNANPKKGLLQVVKKVVWYLKGTMNLEFLYGQIIVKDSFPYSLISYIDSNFARDPEDCKLLIDYYFFLNRTIVLWSSKKQWTIFILTTKAKYIALGHMAREEVWIKRFINKFELEVTKKITLHGNNQMSIALTKKVES